MSAYHVIICIIAVCIVLVLLQSRPQPIVPEVNKPVQEDIVNNNISSFTPTNEELIQLSDLSLKYTSIVNQISDLREYELKVTNGYVSNQYTEKQISNLVSQTTATKDAILTDIKNDNVYLPFSDLKTLMERYVRAELNSSKKVLANIKNGEKAAIIYNDFSGSTGTMTEHVTNMCNELEKLLYSYKIKYERNGNMFSF